MAPLIATSVFSEPSEPGEPGKTMPQTGGESTDANAILHIHIPYLGTAQIQLSATVGTSRALLELHRPTQPSQVQNGFQSEGHSCPKPDLPQDYTNAESVNTDWQNMPSDLQSLCNTTLDQNIFGFDQDTLDTSSLLIPGVTADAEHWALQGVDVALFDSLIRGASEPEAAPPTSCPEVAGLAAPSAGSKDGSTIYDCWI